MAHFRDALKTLYLAACLGLIHSVLRGIELKEFTEGTDREIKYSKKKILCKLRQHLLRILRKCVCWKEWTQNDTIAYAMSYSIID